MIRDLSNKVPLIHIHKYFILFSILDIYCCHSSSIFDINCIHNFLIFVLYILMLAFINNFLLLACLSILVYKQPSVSENICFMSYWYVPIMTIFSTHYSNTFSWVIPSVQLIFCIPTAVAPHFKNLYSFEISCTYFK